VCRGYRDRNCPQSFESYPFRAQVAVSPRRTHSQKFMVDSEVVDETGGRALALDDVSVLEATHIAT